MAPALTTTTPMLPRPKFRRSSSSHGATTPADEEIFHLNFFLDNRLPTDYFKQDILHLIHSLHISRWKVVEKEMAGDLVVARISGALTNSVYSVDPPPSLKDMIKKHHPPNSAKTYHHKVPKRLLLRVYGPQVEHIIDREKELATVSRLSARKIGPRLLGTFKNGRFEQFLHAKPLTKEDIRDPEISLLIAKRMRELHDGVRLLDDERAKGPGVWQCLEKWTEPALEKLRLLELTAPHATQRIVQADWATFAHALKRYRDWIVAKYSEEGITKELVFSHNDTQYGNILRIEPPKGSPLLVPAYEHRQLVVIDFEYSSGNSRGYDISNHFCEWMADYHDAQRSYHIHNDRYPTPAQQLNMINGYVEHGYDTFDDEDKMEAEAKYLQQATVDWRPAVHAYWMVWGIVQAVLDHDDDLRQREHEDSEHGVYKFEKHEAEKTEHPPEEVEEDYFDYLAYSAEKAQMFWTDLIALGLVDAAEYKGIIKTVGGPDPEPSV